MLETEDTLFPFGQVLDDEDAGIVSPRRSLQIRSGLFAQERTFGGEIACLQFG